MTLKEQRVNLRLPISLRDRISSAAEEAGRSMNAEVVHRLTSSFQSDSYPASAAQIEYLSRLEGVVARLEMLSQDGGNQLAAGMRQMAAVAGPEGRGRTMRPARAAEMLGLGLSTFWRYAKIDPDFPRPIKLSPRCTVFYEGDLKSWVERKIDREA